MKHETLGQKAYRLRKASRDNSARAAAYENVFSFPENQVANIEKWKQKIEEIKHNPELTRSEKKQKIERCEKKIAEIKKSIETFYVQHPYVQKRVCVK